MPIGLNSLALQGFYKLPELAFGKSIQPSYRFFATFLENPYRNFDKDVGSMPVIPPYLITSVSIPTYNFKLEKVYYGVIPRTFSTLDHEGFVLTVGFEEDENGTVAYFINWLQRCLIDKNGYYKGPLRNRIGNFVVEVQDRQGMPVVYYVFKNIFYQSSDPVTYDYASNETIKYSISFGVDFLETWFVKAGIIDEAKKSILSSFKSKMAVGIK